MYTSFKTWYTATTTGAANERFAVAAARKSKKKNISYRRGGGGGLLNDMQTAKTIFKKCKVRETNVRYRLFALTEISRPVLMLFLGPAYTTNKYSGGNTGQNQSR